MQTLESPSRSGAELRADAEITAAVERHFITSKDVTSHLMEVSTQEGIVELTGAAGSLLARRRAEEIAMAVRGVRGVVNELVVNADDVPDSQLHRDVEHALADDSVVRDYHLRVYESGGTVWLTGTVRSWPEKQLALRAVEGVRGVRHIQADQLRVNRDGPPKPDADITAQLLEVLDWDVRVNKSLVQVRTNDRVVHLTGTVGSLAVKHRIEGLALELGAARVDGRDLFVARWALAPELGREEDLERTDEAIEKAVRDTFRRDPRLQEANPLVQVQKGAVTLSGTVGNLRARLCAEHDARHVAGVREVHNQLTVSHGRFWSDDYLRQRVAAALRRDPYLSSYHFSVSLLNGRASVHGWVNHRFEQEQVYDVAVGVNGVVDVENQVAVYPDGHRAAQALAGGLTGDLSVAEATVPDDKLAENIRARYSWSALLHDQAIEVAVARGRVTLTGTVDSWLERQQAAREAHEVGARDVNNHLRVWRAAPTLSAPLVAAS
ncbi:BON domain-containing protein [Hymenobacter convexus]|uniref:BON domain-containing protein n=1 Tax=Hymenobacter sp. CA1UV-4 TaxID=3063782 RepID=UPI0027127535|nr:BON domain-containing protein [Hymenobacter sp. CA1UV-4]MDO7852444.1 BON domain-containing protein [Hymenobacter sp. CA1UV-4]